MLLLLACAHRPELPVAAPLTLVDEADLAVVFQAPTGAPLVASAWASWCGPCIAELPTLEHFAATHPDVRVVLVNADTASARAEAARLAPPSATSWYLDAEDPGAALFRVWPGFDGAIPSTVVMGPDGTLRATYKGAVTLEDLVDATQAQATVPRW